MTTFLGNFFSSVLLQQL